MARGNLILGQGAGKLGDVVLYRNAGQQQARAYVSNPKNPKSYKQALQRAKFASVALAYQYFKNIVDRSTRYKDGRTAYNDFLKNNISAAPYASKSERQEWAGLYALPAQWTLAFGALARPAVWTPTATAGTGSNPSNINFGTTDDLCRQILNYADANGWLPLNPTSGDEITLTKEQMAEALAGAPNCHVCMMASASAQVGDYNDQVNANGAKVFELTADKLGDLVNSTTIQYDESTGWTVSIADAASINAIGGVFGFGEGTSAGSPTPQYVHVAFTSAWNSGFTFGAWIGNNSGSSVQVSNVILDYVGTAMTTTATNRRDESEAETAAAIASWQTEEAAGSDSNIY